MRDRVSENGGKTADRRTMKGEDKQRPVQMRSSHVMILAWGIELLKWEEGEEHVLYAGEEGRSQLLLSRIKVL